MKTIYKVTLHFQRTVTLDDGNIDMEHSYHYEYFDDEEYAKKFIKACDANPDKAVRKFFNCYLYKNSLFFNCTPIRLNTSDDEMGELWIGLDNKYLNR